MLNIGGIKDHVGIGAGSHKLRTPRCIKIGGVPLCIDQPLRQPRHLRSLRQQSGIVKPSHHDIHRCFSSVVRKPFFL